MGIFGLGMCLLLLRITNERNPPGVERYEVSLEKQSVVVYPTTATYDEVLEKIKKTGKEVCVVL